MAAIIDNEARAQQLARAIASDIQLYNKEKIEKALIQDHFFDALNEEITEGRDLFRSRVTPELFHKNFYGPAIRRAASLTLTLLLVTACGREPSPAVDKPAKTAPAAQKPAPAALPPLSTDGADKVVAALADIVDPAHVPMMAARGLAEVEVGRLPAFLLDALTAITTAAPERRSLGVARALDAVPGRMAWIQACRGGLQVFEDLAEATPAERGALLWRECALADLGLADEATIAAADPTMVILALVAFDHLRRNGEVASQERMILQAMLHPAKEG